MAQLLVSVRDAAEARAALAGGADVIDVKEPSRGALGRADASVWAAVLRACSGADGGRRAAVSVALGEAGEALDRVPADAWCGAAPGGALDRPDVPPRTPLPAGLRWAKLGPAGADPGGGHAGDLRDARRRFVPPPGDAGPFEWATVAYADFAAARTPPPADVLAAGLGGPGATFLVDTFSKDGRGLFDHLSPARLTALGAAVKAKGMRLALAGSLRLEDVPRALGCGADVVAVRGAACDGGRTGRVSEAKVRALKAALP